MKKKRPQSFLLSYFNPIPAGGGPVVFFLHNSKSIGLRLLKFSDFPYIPKALPLGLKLGLIPVWVLRHTAWMTAFSCNKLNFCFDPLPLPLQILIKFSFLESLWDKETNCTSFAKKNCKFFSNNLSNDICTFLVFLD